VLAVNGDDVVLDGAGLRITVHPLNHYGFSMNSVIRTRKECDTARCRSRFAGRACGARRFLGFVIRHSRFVIYFARDNCGYRGSRPPRLMAGLD
jgi:hypothetical protein